MPLTVSRLSAAEAEANLPALTDILLDVVEGGGSVSFLWPLKRGEAEKFWLGAIAAVADGRRALLLARDETGPVGTVQLDLPWFPNQPHRADVMKLLVKLRARRRGAARALMRALEDEARRAGRSLLTLDTVTGGAAEKLYRSMGYEAAGVIPGFALSTDGRPEDTTVMYKRLT
jgi:GNAT superfamily N-acetyltransferase